MYREVKSCVMVDGEQTEWFETCMGVRQGCVLSPILYSIFINGFAKAMKESGVGGVPIGNNCCCFADDIVMFAESAEELQRMLEVLEVYCKKWRFETNVGKSKVMVVGGGEEEGEWRYGGKVMGRVAEYKYVGVMVSEDGR